MQTQQQPSVPPTNQAPQSTNSNGPSISASQIAVSSTSGSSISSASSSSNSSGSSGSSGGHSSSCLISSIGTPQQRTYDMGKVLGNGSFGVVCEARCLETGEQVAVKKVHQDPRYKNRELDIMKELKHANVVDLKDYFYTSACDRDGESHSRYLNVVMEHIPETVYRVMKTFVKNSQPMPMLLIKLYTYQMCRALAYLHSLGVCHRDIKPQNLLVDSRSHVLKLCDFGSAKKLVPAYDTNRGFESLRVPSHILFLSLEGEQSVAYICSRFYRAPELMLGATEYTTAIDIWSIGCVLGELLLGRPLFAGETSVDQLVKIIQILGTPARRQMSAMNPNYTEFRFPDVKPREWRKVLGSQCPDEAMDLLSRFLKYEPSERLLPIEAMAHEFFDELRDPHARLPGGGPLPELFSFTESELRQMSPVIRLKCVPSWYKNPNLNQS